MQTNYKFTSEETKEIIRAGLKVLHPTLHLGKSPRINTYDSYDLGMTVTPDDGAPATSVEIYRPWYTRL